MAGTNNDINLLNASAHCQDIMNNYFNFSTAIPNKVIHGIIEDHFVPYFLVVGTCPSCRMFACPVTDVTVDQVNYKNAQE